MLMIQESVSFIFWEVKNAGNKSIKRVVGNAE
jgi:hypothetical protein